MWGKVEGMKVYTIHEPDGRDNPYYRDFIAKEMCWSCAIDRNQKEWRKITDEFLMLPFGMRPDLLWTFIMARVPMCSVGSMVVHSSNLLSNKKCPCYLSEATKIEEVPSRREYRGPMTCLGDKQILMKLAWFGHGPRQNICHVSCGSVGAPFSCSRVGSCSSENVNLLKLPWVTVASSVTGV